MYLYTELLEVFPKFKKFFWKNLYQYLGRYKYPEWTFMNYGYDLSIPTYLKKEDEVNRYSIQLYDKVIGGTQIKDKKILEIGCGRGGGLSYINKYYKPLLTYGIDLSDNAINFCKDTHNKTIVFNTDDACNINLPSESFDVIINVESSHCYDPLSKFFEEVYRVLKKNGTFLYADLCVAKDQEIIKQYIKDAGFEIVEQESIVKGVLSALDADNNRKLAMIKAKVPFLIRWPFLHFAGMVGSRPYRSFESGERAYNRFVLRKAT